MNRRFIALPTAALLLAGIPGVALADDDDDRGKEDVSCESVIHIGDSNSVALEQAGLKKAYEDAGVKDVSINASVSRTLHETVGNGSPETNEDNGVDGLTRELAEADDDVCVVMALGVNDSGNIGPGASVGAEERIDAVMEVAGDDRVVFWPDVIIGSAADARFKSGADLFNQEIDNSDYDNLHRIDLLSHVKDEWLRDGIHYTPEGYANLKELLVQAVTSGVDDADDGEEREDAGDNVNSTTSATPESRDGNSTLGQGGQGTSSGTGSGSAAGDVPHASTTVIHIGDSNTVAAEKSDILSEAYEEAGLQATINASGGCSLKEYLNGGSPDTNEDNGVDGLIRELEQADGDATVVMAMGVNDAANIVVGSATDASARIEAVMEAAGEGRLVVWPTVAVGDGAAQYYTEDGAESFNEALRDAAEEHDNLLLVDWAESVEDEWFADGIHYNEEGYRAFADMIVEALESASDDDGANSDDADEDEGGNEYTLREANDALGGYFFDDNGTDDGEGNESDE